MTLPHGVEVEVEVEVEELQAATSPGEAARL